MKTRVAIWAAVSSKPQAAEDKTSLDDQENLGRQFTKSLVTRATSLFGTKPPMLCPRTAS